MGLNSILLTIPVLLFVTAAFAKTMPNYIRANAIQMESLEIPAKAITILSKSHFLLIGDYHGTKEIPKVVYSIVKSLSKKSKVGLGFEFPIDIQRKVAKFMQTGDENILRRTRFFRDPTFNSGKGSLQMVELLKSLRDLRNVEIFCFDVPAGDTSNSAQRETELATNILSVYRKRRFPRTIIYTGNIHSRLTKGVPWDEHYPTMGSEIVRLSNPHDDLSSISSILFRPGAGSAFNCQIKNRIIQCGPHRITTSHANYFSVFSSNYFLKEPSVTDGHPLSIILHSVSASMPFK